MSQTMRAIFPNLNEKDTLNLVHSTVFSRVYNSVFGLFNEMVFANTRINTTNTNIQHTQTVQKS